MSLPLSLSSRFGAPLLLKIGAVIIAILLVATLLLGTLLKRSYEANGRIESDLEKASQVVKDQKGVISRLEASKGVNDKICLESAKEKTAIKASTEQRSKTIKESAAKGNTNVPSTENSSISQLDVDIVRVLQLAECSAKRGIACSPSDINPSLSRPPI
jgi:hypothetical protein